MAAMSPTRSAAPRPAATTPRPAASAAITPQGGQPLYRGVMRALLASIEGGQHAPGAALPNEADLALRFGVSIGTVRRAVDELVADHIVVRRQGRGTYVATHNADRFLFQFFHVERGDGLRENPQVETVSFQKLRLDDEAAEALGLRAGEPAIQFEHRLRLQGRPVVYDRITVAARLFPGLTEKKLTQRPGTIYQLYQAEFGITVVRAQERARAVAADRNIARILGVAAGLPMIQVRRTAYSFRDRPVEYRVSTIHTAQHDYINVLSRPA